MKNYSNFIRRTTNTHIIEKYTKLLINGMNLNIDKFMRFIYSQEVLSENFQNCSNNKNQRLCQNL